MRKIQNMQVPYYKGKVLNYVSSWEKEEVEWKDNFIFEDTLILEEIHRGRSAANFIFKSKKDENQRFVMFLKDVFDICNSTGIKKGKLKGKFTFCKRGANYGVQLIIE